MKAEPMRDGRLDPAIPVRRRGGDIIIDAVAWTPLRLTLVLHAVALPIINVSRVVLFVAAIWGGGIWAGLLPFADDLPFDWRIVIGAAVLAQVLFYVDRATHFLLLRGVFGRRLRITITPGAVMIGRIWPFRRMFPRSQRVTFAMVPIERAVSPVYIDSSFLCVIVNDARRIRIGEIFDRRRIEKLVGNANIALAIAESEKGKKY